jgi:hypothetical protein
MLKRLRSVRKRSEYMKWLRIFILLVIISIFIPSGIALAASPSVDNVKVYTDYYETDDWLVVATINISGGNLLDCTNTSCFRPPDYTWYIQFYDNAGSAVVTENKILQGNMSPFGISINATQASTLVWNGNYSVKIYGNYGAIPNASKTLTAIDWRGEVADGELDEWVLQQAQVIEDYTGNDYVTIVPVYDEVLTAEGGSIFNRGIPYLVNYRPDIFQLTTYSYPIGYVPSTGSTDYADALYDNWDIVLGPDVSGVLTTSAPYLGFAGADGGRMIGALLTIIGFLAIALIEKSIAFMVILGGVLIGVFPLATIILLVFVAAVLLIRGLFWSST